MKKGIFFLLLVVVALIGVGVFATRTVQPRYGEQRPEDVGYILVYGKPFPLTRQADIRRLQRAGCDVDDSAPSLAALCPPGADIKVSPLSVNIEAVGMTTIHGEFSP